MGSSAAIEARLTSLWETPKSTWGWFATVDHKELGIRYLVTAFIFLLIGGVEALIMRLQLSRADQSLLSPEVYDQIFTMRGVTMSRSEIAEQHSRLQCVIAPAAFHTACLLRAVWHAATFSFLFSTYS